MEILIVGYRQGEWFAQSLALEVESIVQLGADGSRA